MYNPDGGGGGGGYSFREEDDYEIQKRVKLILRGRYIIKPLNMNLGRLTKLGWQREGGKYKGG